MKKQISISDPDKDPKKDTDISCFEFSPIDEETCGISIKDFDNCPEHIVIPKEYGKRKVTRIDGSAFEYCCSVKSICIPNGVTEIGDAAFFRCSSLADISIPDSLTCVGDAAFWGCSSLCNISLPDSVGKIGDSAFLGCSSLESVSLPIGIDEIGRSVFCECPSLKSIRLPNALTRVGDSAFCGCSSLMSISLPSGVTSIGVSAFENCSGLFDISLPDSLMLVESFAFKNCSCVNEINIPASVTSIKSNPFIGIPISKINIEYENTCYKKQNNCIIEADTGNLVAGDETSIIPNGTGSIDDFAFCDCNSLSDVLLPESITFIGVLAFSGCTSLKKIRFQGNESAWNRIEKKLAELPKDVTVMFDK